MHISHVQLFVFAAQCQGDSQSPCSLHRQGGGISTGFWLGMEASGVWWDGMVCSRCRLTNMLMPGRPGIESSKKGWHIDLC